MQAIVLFLLTNLLLTENLGLLSGPISKALGLVCLIALGAGIRTSAAGLRGWIGRAGELASYALALILPPALSPLAICLALAGAQLRSDRRVVNGGLATLAAAEIVFSALALVATVTPALWLVASSASRALTGFIGSLTGQGVTLSSGVCGAPLVGLLLSLALADASRDRIGGRDIMRAVGLAALFLVLWIIYLSAAVHAPQLIQSIAGRRWPAFATTVLQNPGRVFAFAPIVLLITMSPLLALWAATSPRLGALRRPGARPESDQGAPTLPARSRMDRRVALSAAVMALIGWIVLFLPLRPTAAKRPHGPATVALYEKGFLNWMRPSFEDFGQYSAGMFGLLPDHLSTIGIHTRRIPDLASTNLDGADALAIINLDHQIHAADKEAVWAFVRNGGSLLVLGDHTFKKGGAHWINDLLSPTHIRLEFDSAIAFVGGWLESYAFARHPLVRGLGNRTNEPGIVTGASLRVTPPAAPVIVGRYGFSDYGDDANEKDGYLGNFMLDAGEAVGDLVLAAVEPCGRGKVLVFGDTSGFTNLLGASTDPFIRRAFLWLTTPGARSASARREILGASLAIVGVAILASSRRDPLIPALTVLPAAALWLLWPRPTADALSPGPQTPIAYIDVSHQPRVPLDFGRDNGLSGLMVNLYRHGYHALWMHEFDTQRLQDAKLLVLVSPARSFSAKELRSIQSFLDSGGFLMLTVGYEESRPLGSLLRALGFAIQPVPLGHLSADTEGGPAVFVEAWPLQDTQPTAATRTSERAGETAMRAAVAIAASDGYSLILARRVGRGTAILIGDSSFFINKNLEHDDHPHMESIQFLHWILNWPKTHEPSRNPDAEPTAPR